MAGLSTDSPLAPAIAALDRGDVLAAEQLLVAHLDSRGEDPDALVLLAAVRRSNGPRRESNALLERAVAAEPGHGAARLGLIDLAIEGARFAEGLEHLLALPADVRSSFAVLAREADLRHKLGHHDQELALYDQMIALEPDTVTLWASKANTLRILGRNAEAVAVLHDALAIRPDYVQPWWLLSDLKDYRFDAEAVATMTRLLDEQTLESKRIPLHFALGKAYEDMGRIAEAFEHYSAGNALRAATFGRERIGIIGKVNRTIARFDCDFLSRRAGGGHASDEPIFIVGLPRSGSTLVEQILASHPAIEGTSELPVLEQIMREIATDDSLAPGNGIERLAMLSPAQRKAYGQRYLDGAAPYRHTGRPRFVDKMPSNWLQIGLIRLILPNARIVDARRHPLATGLSNFKQNFGGGGFFTYGQATIAAFTRQYLRLISHFERIDPGSIHRVVNERLIADFEKEVRALLDFVGVPFDPACLEFHRTIRAVATPSSAQVRRPINRDGVDQWRTFEPYLGELKQALGPALTGWDLPPGEYRDEER